MWIISLFFTIIFLFFTTLIFLFRNRKLHSNLVGFFHPYCNDGGGGERVLWCCIKTIQERYPEMKCIIYTGFDGKVPSPQDIFERTESRFKISIDSTKVDFIFLKNRWLVEASTYPRVTLFGQSIGSMFLAIESIFRSKQVPFLMIDSMGYAFTYPVFRLLSRTNMACYVHYPTISTDMLSVVASGKSAHNNSSSISNSKWKTLAKLWYYKLFAKVYGIMGSFSQVVMVNSTWTSNHISKIWNTKPNIVYPPCNTSTLTGIPLSSKRDPLIISIAQFRPEKDHMLQILSLHELLEKFPTWKSKGVKLVLIGSCRNEEDYKRLDSLKLKVQELDLNNFIDFRVNVPFKELQNWLETAMIGLHTMWNEHFGIGVVELMAAGVITIAHNSGGPKEDIVVPYQGENTGYLATTSEEYAAKMDEVLSMNEKERRRIQEAARSHVSKFSDELFFSQFHNCMKHFFPKNSN